MGNIRSHSRKAFSPFVATWSLLPPLESPRDCLEQGDGGSEPAGGFVEMLVWAPG